MSKKSKSVTLRIGPQLELGLKSYMVQVGIDNMSEAVRSLVRVGLRRRRAEEAKQETVKGDSLD